MKLQDFKNMNKKELLSWVESYQNDNHHWAVLVIEYWKLNNLRDCK